jgi:hypothetical protein
LTALLNSLGVGFHRESSPTPKGLENHATNNGGSLQVHHAGRRWFSPIKFSEHTKIAFEWDHEVITHPSLLEFVLVPGVYSPDIGHPIGVFIKPCTSSGLVDVERLRAA